jgi:hypothetical protein
MRKLIKRLGSAVVTFIIGVAISIAWSHLYVRKVSLCMLARDPAAYHGKTIRVEALGSVISSALYPEKDLVVFEPGCEESDAWAAIDLDRDQKLSAEVDQFMNSPTVEIRDAKVVVEGRFDQKFSLGCFSPRFRIRGATVRLVSQVTSKPLPQRPAETR